MDGNSLPIYSKEVLMKKLTNSPKRMEPIKEGGTLGRKPISNSPSLFKVFPKRIRRMEELTKLKKILFFGPLENNKKPTFLPNLIIIMVKPKELIIKIPKKLKS